MHPRILNHCFTRPLCIRYYCCSLPNNYQNNHLALTQGDYKQTLGGGERVGLRDSSSNRCTGVWGGVGVTVFLEDITRPRLGLYWQLSVWPCASQDGLFKDLISWIKRWDFVELSLRYFTGSKHQFINIFAQVSVLHLVSGKIQPPFI